MNIKEFSIIRYGPLPNTGRISLHNFNLFFGKNEDGKTLTIDALVKLLLGRNIRDFEHIERVEENPEGYVIVEDDKGKEIKLPEKGNLTKVADLASSECRNIFVIRNSDLSIARENEFYTNVTDRLTGLRAKDIFGIKDILKDIGKITPSGIFRDIKDEKLKTRIDDAIDLIEKIENLAKKIKETRFDELEEELVRQREERDKIIQKVENLEDARKREKYEKGKEALSTLKNTLEKVKELEIYNEEDKQLWSRNDEWVKEYGEQKKKLSTKLEKKEENLTIGSEELEEKERAFQIIEQRRELIDELEREIKEIISSTSELARKEKEKVEIEENAREIEEEFQILSERKKAIDEKVRPYVADYKQKKEELRSQEIKNKFFTPALIACTILLVVSLMGAIVKPLILFYIFSSFFLVSSLIFGILKFQFIRGKADLARLFEKIKLNLSQVRLEAADFEGICSNLQGFDEEFLKRERKRIETGRNRTLAESTFEVVNDKHRKSIDKITEAIARLGWSEQDDLKEYLLSIQKFREEFSSKNKELENARIKKKGLENEIEELEKKQIPEIESKIKKTEYEINNIKSKSGEESFHNYFQKLKTKQEYERLIEEQKRILESLFETRGRTLEENISYWDEEVRNLEEYKDKAKDMKYSETVASELEKKKRDSEDKLEKINDRMVPLQKEMEDVERKVNEVLRLEDEYLYCKTSVDLEAVKDNLKNFIIENESNKDNVLKVVKIFEEIEAEEKEKVSELFGKESPISKYFNGITVGLYEEVTFNQETGEIEVKRRDGNILEAEKLSGGAYDQLYLSIRLALGEKLLKGKKGFFIMDDPFVKADPDRLQRQIDTLKRISEWGWQIIYFSAKGEIKAVLQKDIDNGSINYVEVPRIPILEQIDQTRRSLNFLDPDAHENNKLITETGESSAKEG